MSGKRLFRSPAGPCGGESCHWLFACCPTAHRALRIIPSPGQARHHRALITASDQEPALNRGRHVGLLTAAPMADFAKRTYGPVEVRSLSAQRRWAGRL